MSTIVVTPPYAALAVVLVRSSVSKLPAWTCVSTTPGISQRPERSWTSAASGSGSPGPTTAAIRPALTATAPAVTTRSSRTRSPRSRRSCVIRSPAAREDLLGLGAADPRDRLADARQVGRHAPRAPRAVGRQPRRVGLEQERLV